MLGLAILGLEGVGENRTPNGNAPHHFPESVLLRTDMLGILSATCRTESRGDEALLERWNGRAATAALVTPLTKSGAIDVAKLCAHVKNLIDRGLDAVVPFGTTGEGASFGLAEKEAALEALMKSGVPADRIICAIMASAIEDAAATVKRALGWGCAGILLTPPFYYHGVAPAGVVRWYSQVIEKVGPGARDIILYHIPSVTGVNVTPEAVTELHRRFGKVIAAIKDSSGDQPTTEAFLALRTVPVMVGHEGYLAAMVRKGAVGCISGLANIVPERIARIVRTGNEDPAFMPAVDAVVALPVVPAVRAILAHAVGDESWAQPIAPLEKLTPAQANGLVERWNALMK
jgi:4-hydroxy-tetrahydrodipicolinate synthase